MQIGHLFNSDAEIVDGIKRSDDRALSILYKKHYKMVRYFVTRNSGREEDAEDVFQTGVIVLYEKIKAGDFNEKSSVKTYLYSICRNQWLKQLRNKPSFISIVETEHGLPIEISDAQTDLTFEQNALTNQLLKLDERCRKILVSYYYEQLSMDEIAHSMGYTNADNAKTQKYRCIQRLKEMVGSEIRL